jgi:glycosyltransferase involved in cell wall biosynthesis
VAGARLPRCPATADDPRRGFGGTRDSGPHAENGSGIYRYSYQLVEHLQAVDTENEYVVLLGRRALEKWQPGAPNFRAHPADHAIYSLGEQTGLLRTLIALEPDLVHFTSFNAPLLYRGRRVTTVHDLTYLEFPSVRDASPLGRARYRARDLAMRAVLRTSLRRSSATITDTRYVRQQLLARYGGDGRTLSADSTIAIHCGAAQLRAAEAAASGAESLPAGVEEPYVLHVGHAYPHKNLRRLIDGLELVRREVPDLRLVLVGPSDSFYEALREYAGGRPEVVFPGFVSEAQLAALYRRAHLFVLPSQSEGFGLPALEAMAHGTPVLCSDATCLPEVCGDGAEYFSPTDVEGMAEKVVALLASPAARDRLRSAGSRRAAEFSWRRMAERTLEVYRAVLREGDGEDYDFTDLVERVSV